VAESTKSGPVSADDGRLQRSERSREAIVRALFDLVGAGNLQPTAEQVADEAGVGIRTVFRHYSDMDSLFVAMDARLRETALPLLLETPPEVAGEKRVEAFLRHRVALFERVAPYIRGEVPRRWRSSFLQTSHARFVRELRHDLLRWIPELEDAPAEVLEAVDLASSFEAWDRLRTEQKLTRSRANEVLTVALRALTRDFLD